MCKFIVEKYNKGYVMSYLDDYLPPISTIELKSIDECVYEMEGIFKSRIKKDIKELVESMNELKSLYEANKLPIEFIGIDLMNSAGIKSSIADRFMNIANEYLDNCKDKE